MKIELTNCKYGVVEIANGAAIHFLDESGILVVVPFTHDNIPGLVENIAKDAGLTEEQKRTLAPLFNGGLFLPGDDYKPGPQG